MKQPNKINIAKIYLISREEDENVKCENVYATTLTTTSAGQEKIKMRKVHNGYNANANNYDIGNVKDKKRNTLNRQCHLSDKDNLGKTESY